MTENNITWIDLIAVGLLVLIVVVIVGVFAREIWRMQRRSRTWQETRGTISGTTLETRKLRTKYGIIDIFYPIVEYTYRIKGHEYTGNRIAFGEQNIERRPAAAEAIIRRYTVGESVTVYYDPDQPAESVLEMRSYNMSRFRKLAWGLVAVVFGLGVMMAILYYLFMALAVGSAAGTWLQ